MKINKYAIIDNERIQIIDCNIILELNACGRGFITVPAGCRGALKNKTLIINVGYGNDLQRFFTGYIESEQTAAHNANRLFIRELIGCYQQTIDCSFQHPTLTVVTEYLTSKNGLQFDLPCVDYVNIKIPHFKHSGTGFHLLREIGRAFNIPEYTFFQTPTGKIYCGSYNDSYFNDKCINFGDNLNKIASSTAGSNIVEIPLVPKLRPGVKINGKKVSIVNLINDDMIITLEDKAGKKSAARRQIEKEFPELADGYHLSKMAKVVAISDEASLGDISTPFRPKYAVNVQLLDENGKESTTPVYKAVPLPVTNIGSEGGSYHYPEEGAEVEIGFINGKPDQPVIRNIYPNNKTMPNIKKNEHLLQQRAEVFTKIDNVGNMIRESDQTITDNARDYCLNSDSSTEKTTTKITTVNANYTINTYSNYKLSANTITQLALKDYTIGTNSNFVQFVDVDYSLTINGNQSISVKNKIDVTANEIKEQIKTIRQSIADAKQEVIAPQVWIGSGEINVLQLMLDTLELIERLAGLTAQHTHPNTPPPTNAGEIAVVKIDAINLDEKYSPVIAK
ncbi:hypothetical protein A9G48_05045 [Gilliamella sp. wkB18]|uniref:hypothetical protein n=1 Tax=Gilliamella sp. wkB18 TaxID=3120260 RepID=UPI00080EDA2B|nr:hypothetical protein [Gilliamella apicola]OCG63827.1 hypothetical protein A9G48_05045 [Gilliamella apicola]